MCGIAGFLSRDGIPPRGVVEAMCRRLAHRGPDGEGFYYDAHAALGHRRLSIIDLETGRQPLGNEDESIQVVFNGEIYNYRELREELCSKGHRFATRSDTEVLVHLYEEMGELLVERLNGMFAFAIWDSRKPLLLLARDRFGKKPLYYTESAPGMRICFASELKSFGEVPGLELQPDPVSLADYLTFSYVPEPATIYRQVLKLPPAHTLTVTREGSRLRRYWEPCFEPGAYTKGFSAAVEELDALAEDAVRRRMISDVPLGGFLSGGVDSSAVVAYMRRSGMSQVRTFSIGFTSKSFDESAYARLVARHCGTAHSERIVSPAIGDVLDVLVEHFDEPFADSSAIPMLYLSRMTRESVTVALCGDGADEIFAGYRRYFYGVLEEQLRALLPRGVRRQVFGLAGHLYPKLDFLPQIFRAKTLLGNLAQELADAYFTSMTAFRDGGLRAILSGDALRATGGYDPRVRYRDRFGRYRKLPALEQLQAVDLETYLPGDILVKADRATMAYSLESRSPWLDWRISELAFRFPSRWKLKGTSGKHIFKQTVGRYLPAEILRRKKMGFVVPLAEWFRSSLRGLFECAVLTPEMEEYLNLREARRLWKEHQIGIADHSRKLWTLLMLACWDLRHRRRRTEALCALLSEDG